MVHTKLVLPLKEIISFLNFMLQSVHYIYLVSKLKLVWMVSSFSSGVKPLYVTLSLALQN